YLTLRVEEDVPGLALTRDGERLERASLGSAVPVDPGDHVVVASAPGRRAVELRVRVAANGDRRTLTFPPLGRLPAAPAGEGAAGPAAPMDPLGFGLVVGGSAFVAAGAVFGVLALETYGEAEDHCAGDHYGCIPAARELEGKARTYAHVADAGV